MDNHGLCDRCIDIDLEVLESSTTADEFNKPYLEEKNRNDKLLEYLGKRLEMGQLKYGKSIPRDDGREWVKEALEEILDAMVYVGNVLLTIQEDKENG
jgi:hypothetical protein